MIRRNSLPRPSRIVRGMINRLGEVIPLESTTITAVRDPGDPDQRKLEAKRARRAQLKRGLK